MTNKKWNRIGDAPIIGARFIDFLKKGYVIPKNKPLLKNQLGVIEQWDGASSLVTPLRLRLKK